MTPAMTNGSEPMIIAEARASDDIALTLRRICSRRRTMSDSFSRISARLPPVSCWIDRLITRKLNSGIASRLAVAHIASSMATPIRI